MAQYAGAIDQGTTSTRFMIFDHGGHVVSIAQKEHEQIYPKPGWVEHDPVEVWSRTEEVVAEALKAAGIGKDELVGASASPTSARRPSSGTATRVSRSTTRSSGRTRAPTASATS